MIRVVSRVASGRVLAVMVLCALCSLPGCGAVAPRSTEALRLELEASGLEGARESAPDLVDSARAALADAERAEAANDLDAASDHATRARLLAGAALAERERAGADRERVELERRGLELEEQIVQQEREARAMEAEGERIAASRTAREELQRALDLAVRDEAHPARRRRHSLADDGAARRAALVIRERARLLAAAAAAMGGDTIALARVEELASGSAVAPPIEGLELAEQAHEAAREALASARRARPGPTAEEIASASEAAEQAGLHPLRLERGLGIEVEGVFRGTTAQPTPEASARIARVASVVAAHPHGPLAIEIDVSGGGDTATRLAHQRGEWVRRALVEAGIAADRLTFREPGVTTASPDPGERVRVVMVAYVASAATAAAAPTEPAVEAGSPTAGAPPAE